MVITREKTEEGGFSPPQIICTKYKSRVMTHTFVYHHRSIFVEQVGYLPSLRLFL